MKSKLVVIAYPDEYRAEEVLTTLKKLEHDFLIDLEDAAYVVKDKKGRIKLHQSTSLTGAGAVGGSFWGLLIGLLFFVPIAGMVIGAGTGALLGKLSDYGIDDQFAKKITTSMVNGSSAIFILVRSATVDKVVPEIAKYGGTILQTSLSAESEEKLNKAFAQNEMLRSQRASSV